MNSPADPPRWLPEDVSDLKAGCLLWALASIVFLAAMLWPR